MKKLLNLSSILFLCFVALCGCANQTAKNEPASTSNVDAANVSLNKNDYPVFPDTDAGADPAVPAEQGGKGFTGVGWETNTTFDLQGDPHAVKGGTLRDWVPDFPGTLRVAGPESNSQFNGSATTLLYETLLGMDTHTFDFMPSIATHWQISPDKMTFRFRINPNARFSDGMPVTSEDVVATYDFMVDKTLEEPSNLQTYGKLDRPVAESKYIVRIKAKDLNWRNFLYISAAMVILPAHVLNTINGATYIKEYNYKLLPGTGPYTITEEEIQKGKSITLRRRTDYWNEKARSSVGLFNFDEMDYAVVRDENLAFEKFKKGDLDYFVVRPKQWVEDTNFDAIQRGLIQKVKVYNNEPKGVTGLAFNTRRAPYNDLRVRKALSYLINRKQIIEKLAFNEYVPLDSYYPASVYENQNNPKTPYDPELGLKLLSEAGWTGHDAQGRLTKNGQPLQVEMLYASKPYEPYLTVFQEDLRKVGITMNLRFVTPETQFQMMNQRKFEMTLVAWGGLVFPNPETSYHSSQADIDNTNNITGFKNARVDEICKQYDTMFDVQDRIKAIREIDGILANDYQYVLLWIPPYSRLLYWNKFGTPPGHLSRTSDAYSSVPPLWWIDPAKQARVEQGLRDTSVKMDISPLEDKYWVDQNRKTSAEAPKSE